MQSLSEFLEMGGYAAYVWSAYGITAVVLGGLLIATLRDMSARKKALEQLEPKRRSARGGPKAGSSSNSGAGSRE